MKESCGVFGVVAPGRDVAPLTFDGLYALQHRGQESAGMAVSDGQSITVVKDMGLVTAVFDERTVAGLPGSVAIGHTRYSTAGRSEWRQAQPLFRAVGPAGFALAHNGNLTNTAELAGRAGMLPGMATSDTDVLAELLAHELEGRDLADDPSGVADSTGQPGAGPAWPALALALQAVLPAVRGAYSLVLADRQRVYAVRDPHGFRPLSLGRLGPPEEPAGWVVASETPALDIVGADVVRDVEPGELVVLDQQGPRSLPLVPPGERSPSLCIFELVYFARPDAQLLGREVHGARRRMGQRLAAAAPVAADLVIGVPESGVPAAEGYAVASGIPFGHGLVKNRYIGRTFITPGQQARAAGVRRKLNPLRESLAGKRVVVVDDSVVRGTTQRAVVAMLREAGAREVHLRVSSPPLAWPCFYGIDIPERDELLAARLDLPGIAAHLGVDSLAYLSLEDLLAAIDVPGAGFCTACLTGRYPEPPPLEDPLPGATVGARR
ncbi:amidophosphoribosyltransferase [Aciditerrimonas ferrireducens]|uniref:Amidophosphoribosyltransferase n=1 Tax=Aciditerrimonas ferrireducens TaxID=667306 RepID=A0ABV6C438_9ACTN